MPVINSRYNIRKNSNFLLESIRNFKTKLLDIYPVDKNIPVLGISNDDTNRELGRTQKDVSIQKYFTVTVASVEENPDFYNSFSSKKYSVKNVNVGNGYVYKMSLVPVICTLNIAFFSQSYADLIEFADYWIYNKLEGSFQLKIGEQPFDIQVQTETTLSFSGKDLSSGNPFKVETVAKLFTYCGQIEKSPEIDSVTFENVLAKDEVELVVEKLEEKIQ